MRGDGEGEAGAEGAGRGGDEREAGAGEWAARGCDDGEGEADDGLACDVEEAGADVDARAADALPGAGEDVEACGGEFPGRGGGCTVRADGNGGTVPEAGDGLARGDGEAPRATGELPTLGDACTGRAGDGGTARGGDDGGTEGGVVRRVGAGCLGGAEPVSEGGDAAGPVDGATRGRDADAGEERNGMSRGTVAGLAAGGGLNEVPRSSAKLGNGSRARPSGGLSPTVPLHWLHSPIAGRGAPHFRHVDTKPPKARSENESRPKIKKGRG